MSSSNLYNLRRKYNWKKNEQKNLNNSKSKVYTFNENEILEKDYIIEKNHQNSIFILERQSSADEAKKLNKQNQREINSLKYSNDPNKNCEQKSLQLNRYLKEYQYNCYRINDSRQPDVEIKRKKPQDCFSSNKKNITKNVDRESEQKFRQDPSNFQKSLLKKQNQQSICSKEQITLIKLLRAQIDELKQEIQNKNIYIEQLQTKLEHHLMERIEIEKSIQENTELLQNNIRNSETKSLQLLQKLSEYEKQISVWKNFAQKIYPVFSNKGVLSNKRIFQLSDIELELKLTSFLSQLQELTTCKKLITKIHQMKDKIQTKSSFTQLNESNEKFNLKSLWKWLKKLGKEYEIMKHRVQAFDLNQTAIQSRNLGL